MSELVRATLSEREARSLTDEIKLDAERLWGKLLEAYEGGAHLALGYSSWGSYFEVEFGQSGRQGERLLQAARVLREIPATHGSPPNERQARELAPLVEQPDQLQEAWAETVDARTAPRVATAAPPATVALVARGMRAAGGAGLAVALALTALLAGGCGSPDTSAAEELAEEERTAEAFADVIAWQFCRSRSVPRDSTVTEGSCYVWLGTRAAEGLWFVGTARDGRRCFLVDLERFALDAQGSPRGLAEIECDPEPA